MFWIGLCDVLIVIGWVVQLALLVFVVALITQQVREERKLTRQAKRLADQVASQQQLEREHPAAVQLDVMAQLERAYYHLIVEDQRKGRG